MTKPVTIPNTFATATTAIPLSQLDSDFSTVATALNDANTYSNYAADTGVANAYVVTLTGVSTTYSAGLRIQFKAGNANTGASTLNVNGGGTKNITFQDASALSSGTIAANAIVDVMYDGTQFLLMNDPAGTVGTGDVVGPAGATANAVVRFDSTTGKLVKNSVVTIADSTGDMSGVGALTATGNVSFDGGTFVFNESGADKDFRIEGDTEPNLFFTDASTDRVGIGTSSPSQKLHINVASGAVYEQISSGSNNVYLGFDNSRTVGTLQSNNALVFDVGGSYTERMRLDSSGNLGLGVTPSAWSQGKAIELNTVGNSIWSAGSNDLRLSNGSYYNAGYKYAITGSAIARYGMSGGEHQWFNAPSWDGTGSNAISFTQAMTLDASGNLGVGTTSPGTFNQRVSAPHLVVGGGANATGLTLYSGTTNQSSINFAIGTTTTQQYDGGFVYVPNGGSPYLTFHVNGGAERARITSGGRLNIGTTGGSSTRLEIEGGETQCTFINTSATDATYKTTMSFTDSSGAQKGTIKVNNSATQYNTSSDYRLKDNPQPLTGSGAFIDALKPKTWNWKVDGSRGVGFIAHEVQEVSPGSVSGEKDGEQMQAMEYGSAEFIANIIAELQSLRQRVAELEGK